MTRVSKSFNLEDPNSFKRKLFKWSGNSEISVFLNSNNYESEMNEYEVILAVDLHSETPYTKQNSLTKLDDYINRTKDWIFGYLSYDLKNELEKLESKNIDSFVLPNLFFFQPKKIWLVSKNSVEALYLDGSQIQDDWIQINKTAPLNDFSNSKKIKLKKRLSKNQYQNKIR